MKKLFTAFLLLAALAFAGCKNKGSVDDNGVPKTLVIGVVETEKIEQIRDAREQIRKYLEKKLGIPVQLVSSTDYVGVIEALRAKKIHIAEMPPFAYVIASRTLKLTPMVTLGTNGKPTAYQSVIIVKGDSKIKTIEDVKAQAKNLTFCFVDPASTSGHLLPRAYFNSVGINPDNAFKQTIFAGSHSASVLSVKSGKINVGCTTDLIFNIMIQNKLMNEGDVRVIWRSAPIVSDPIVIREDVNKDLAKRVQNAYLDLDKDHPEILKGFMKMFFKDTIRRSYIVANDTLFDGLRKLANGVKDLRAN